MFSTNSPQWISATQVNASSGNVAAAIAAASLPAVASRTNYLTGFEVTGAGATAALPVLVTVVGCLGGTLTYTYSAASTVLTGNNPLVVNFPQPLQATAANTAITVSCPSLGLGNTSNTVNVHGFLL